MSEYVFMFIITFAMGILFLIIGYLLWKRHMITLIHDYHYIHVRDEDRVNYTKAIGKGISLIGIGMISTGIIFWLTHSLLGWFAFVIGFICGVIIMVNAQKKYNTRI